MDQEQAQRFLEAAQHDYGQRVSYDADLSAPGALRAEPEQIREARADVRAAQQVLEVALRERDEAQRHERAGQEYAGVCERCTRIGPRWVVGAAVLCADCAAAAR